ncbi:MAG: GNAT family N-acetyltransferase [bacterium]
MNFSLLPLEAKDLTNYKKDMQQAFQLGAAHELGETEAEVLAEKDINKSLSAKGAVAYKAVVDEEMVGGAIVVINKITQHNHLDFLYVKHGIQNRGIGKLIWQQVEKLHPETKIWETVTPYFEKRNIHFYINQCGFHAVEFFNLHHKDPTIPANMVGGDYFFRFEKYMK